MVNLRLKTGIRGLDELTGGGFLVPSIVLVMGSPGSGKTTFCWHYLSEAAKHREKGILFSTASESISSLVQFAASYWFIDPKKIGKQIFLVDFNQQINTFRTGDEFIDAIDEKIKAFNIQRIVIDPINLIKLSLPDIKQYRFFIFDFSKYIKDKHLHAVITAELYSPHDLYCHEAYISDGTILLQDEQRPRKRIKTLTIVKMRGTPHEIAPVEYSITKNGFELNVER